MTAGKPARNRRSAGQMLAELKQRLREIRDLYAAGDVLNWDQATYMPEGGAGARGRQLATLYRLAHERAVAPALGNLLDSLAHHGESLPYGSDDASLIRVASREYQKKIKVPVDYVARAAAHFSASYDEWTRARPANNFAAMVPYLERTLDLSREYSSYFAPYKHIADPHIDDADEGMTTASTHELFRDLKRQLVPVVRAICAQPTADDSSLRQPFAKAALFDFALHIAEDLGYNLTRGRLDLTHHPFCTRFSVGDVRITTRVSECDFGDALFSTLHRLATPCTSKVLAPRSMARRSDTACRPASMRVSRGSGRIWLRAAAASGSIFTRDGSGSLRSSCRAFQLQCSIAPSIVARSLIRTDADELTYNLHIMLRPDLEMMLEGGLRAKDLPEAWHAAMQADLDIGPSNDRNGCLQDAHWYSGYIGGRFQSYTIGNILSAQFYAAALKAYPDIPREIAGGEFGTLRGWLRDNLYRHGNKFAPNDLVERATGTAMQIKPYLDYLREKYGALYRLPANA
jgi:carboxypeptidase Taq